ncbi:MAG TPA: GNAT family N-acetyltransferase [Pyrinomonadaceae bacterium]|jgi:GNAT superfamily N-acetyltransferase|nr:GNAT family N-acetyltransferase [Pyrinomonadaceae bacterium]
MDPLEIRLLFESDIPAAMKLKEAAGWNQTEADWRRLLKLEPNGCFAAIENDRLVGTTTTTTYKNDLAWIGMVLVDPQHRRRGIASRLVETALAYLDRKVAVIKLDATADGSPVYEKFGFKTESVIERWGGTVTARSSEREDRAINLDALLTLDRRAFNADRSRLIRSLIDESRITPVLVKDGSGYALARSGTRAAYLGPVVTDDPAQIENLLERSLDQLSDSNVYIDFNDECGVSSSVLADRGFVKERDLIRMSLGSSSTKTSPLVIAIAGPEVG